MPEQVAQSGSVQQQPSPIQSPSKKKFSMESIVKGVTGQQQTQQPPQAPVQPTQNQPSTPVETSTPSDTGFDIPLSILGIQESQSTQEAAPVQQQSAPVQPQADEPMPDMQNWAEAQRQAFIRDRQEKTTFKKKLAEVTAELESLKKNQQIAMPTNPFDDPAVQTRIKEGEDAKARIAQMEQELAKTNIQYDPRFRAEFEIPANEKMSLIESYLKHYGKDRAFGEQLAALGIKERIEVLGKEVPQLAAALLPLYSEIDMIQSKKQQALQNAKQMEGQYATQREEQIKQLKARHYSDAVKQLQANGHFLYLDEADIMAKAPNLAPIAKQIRMSAAEILNSGDPAVATKAMLMAAETPWLHQQLRALTKENARLKSDIAKFGGITPRTGGNQQSASMPATNAGAKTSGNQGKSFMERQVAAAQAALQK